MADEATGSSIVRNLQQDLEAQPQASGIELQEISLQTPLRRRIRSRSVDSLANGRKQDSIPSFFQKFRDRAAQDTGSDHCLFLCWGPTGNQWAIDIPVSDPDHEVEIYRHIRKHWYDLRGRWRRLLPVPRVAALKEVKVNLVHDEVSLLMIIWY